MSICCIGDYLSAGYNFFLTHTDAKSAFLALKQSCWKTHPMDVGKMLVYLKKSQIIGMYQPEKTSSETAETTKTGFRTVQDFNKLRNLEI